MLSATDLPTEADRRLALSKVAWHPEARSLAGRAFGLLRNQSADLIDVAVGTVHARAALVAFQEGADAIFQAGIDLVDGTLAEEILGRSEPRDPLGEGEALHDGEDSTRLRKRALRVRIEDAAIRLAVAGNHLVNAHLRLAWEANAAGKDEVIRCGFDPHSNRFDNWADVDRAARAIKRLRDDPLAVLPHFVLQQELDSYLADADVQATRWLRHRIVHRDRPSYADAPAIGRASLWTGDSFKVSFPPKPGSSGTDASLDEVRSQISRAAVATLAYADSIWNVAVSWLMSVDVDVKWEPGEVRVTVQLQPGQTSPRRPREQRDPGPFLVSD